MRQVALSVASRMSIRARYSSAISRDARGSAGSVRTPISSIRSLARSSFWASCCWISSCVLTIHSRWTVAEVARGVSMRARPTRSSRRGCWTRRGVFHIRRSNRRGRSLRRCARRLESTCTGAMSVRRCVHSPINSHATCGRLPFCRAQPWSTAMLARSHVSC